MNGTGTTLSAGQYVDLSKVIPAGAKVTNVIAYCPKSVRVTQTPYCMIDAFVIKNGSKKAEIKFYRTDEPTPFNKCNTTAFYNMDASTKWFVQIRGTNAAVYSPADGFTIYPGCKFIVEYTK